jgi:polyisoprenoid-binding protein YceI
LRHKSRLFVKLQESTIKTTSNRQPSAGAKNHLKNKTMIMKKNVFPAAALLIIVACAFTVIDSQEWKIQDNYSVKFTSKDPSGVFTGLKGSINFDEKDLATAKFDVTIDVATINTGNGMKNTHAKSAMWWDAEKYPTIHFTSTSISKTAAGFDAKGILDMHGVQKEIVIPFTFADNIFTGSFDVNRLDYNVNVAEPEHGAAIFKIDISVPVSK